MAKLFAVCVLMLCFYEAFGLKCNNCTSTASLKDCDKTKQEKTCPAGQDYCATLSTVFNRPNASEIRSFVRSCSTKALCDDSTVVLQACTSANGTCSYECCNTDLCNGGNAVSMVSTFLLLSCALVTLFR